MKREMVQTKRVDTKKKNGFSSNLVKESNQPHFNSAGLFIEPNFFSYILDKKKCRKTRNWKFFFQIIRYADIIGVLCRSGMQILYFTIF